LKRLILDWAYPPVSHLQAEWLDDARENIEEVFGSEGCVLRLEILIQGVDLA